MLPPPSWLLRHSYPANVDNLQLCGTLSVQGDRHPNKDIRKAIEGAQNVGWQVERAKGKGHRWGTLRCGRGCAVALAGTPRRPSDIAKRIHEAVRKCDHELNSPTSILRPWLNTNRTTNEHSYQAIDP